jgi:hypothetical protein
MYSYMAKSRKAITHTAVIMIFSLKKTPMMPGVARGREGGREGGRAGGERQHKDPSGVCTVWKNTHIDDMCVCIMVYRHDTHTPITII